MDSDGSDSDRVSGIAGLATGVGMLMLVLFPLAIPFVSLTIVATLPLALPLIAIAAIAAVPTGAWLGIRAAGRGIRRLARSPGRPRVTGRRSTWWTATRSTAPGGCRAATRRRP
jgi:hypothetical protein